MTIETPLNAPVSAGVVGAHETTQTSVLQEASSSANIDWKGNTDYFQSGSKAGQLKPRARTKAGQAPAREAGGLDIESLRATQAEAGAPAPEDKKQKQTKAEKKIVEAKIAAKLVMRTLDTFTQWISKGTFGAEFTEPQRKERNKYREELEEDWQTYLHTLDIPMHPALVCVLGSMTYVAPAFNTSAGQERAQTIKEKIISKLAVKIFGGKK